VKFTGGTRPQLPPDLVHTENAMWKRLLGFFDSSLNAASMGIIPSNRLLDELGGMARMSDNEIRLIAHDSHLLGYTCGEQTSSREIWNGLLELREKYAVRESDADEMSVDDDTVVVSNDVSNFLNHNDDSGREAGSDDDGIVELTKKQFKSIIDHQTGKQNAMKRPRIVLNAKSGLSDHFDSQLSGHIRKDFDQNTEENSTQNGVGFNSLTSMLFIFLIRQLNKIHSQTILVVRMNYMARRTMNRMLDLSEKGGQRKCSSSKKATGCHSHGQHGGNIIGPDQVAQHRMLLVRLRWHQISKDGDYSHITRMFIAVLID
jgi:hypothetical protein